MRCALLAALTVLAPACTDTSGDALQPVPLDEVSAAYKDATCRYYTRCGLFPDQGTCIEAQLNVAFAFDPNVEAGIRDGRIFYEGRNVADCFKAIETQTCNLTDIDGRVVVPGCRHFTRGLVGGGNSCYLDADCVSARCVGGNTDMTCQLGLCLGDQGPTDEPGDYNEPCNPVGGCVSNTYCNIEMNLCLMLQHEGLSCTKTDQCAFGIGCAGGICQELPTAGEPCPDGVCRDVQEACVGTPGTSPRCVSLGLAGAACTSNATCAPSFFCDLTNGECTQLPGVGQSCAATGRCFAEGTFCDATNTCVVVKPDGQPCAFGNECRSGLCDPGTNLCTAAMICPPP